MMNLLVFPGLAPSKNDKKIQKLVTNSYKNVRVVGRGTVKIDAAEVRKSSEFQAACKHARGLVEAK